MPPPQPPALLKAPAALGAEQGMGLDDRLRARGDRFFGILNGLDTDLWDPATDSAIAAPYSRADRSGKAACRAALLQEVGLDPADPGAVLAMIDIDRIRRARHTSDLARQFAESLIESVVLARRITQHTVVEWGSFIPETRH